MNGICDVATTHLASISIWQDTRLLIESEIISGIKFYFDVIVQGMRRTSLHHRCFGRVSCLLDTTIQSSRGIRGRRGGGRNFVSRNNNNESKEEVSLQAEEDEEAKAKVMPQHDQSEGLNRDQPNVLKPEDFTLNSPRVVQFRLMEKEFKLSITEFNVAFGFINEE
ncbi:hypothetical protein Fot_10841 [Forsythia ovata]|uniref:Uncharacterized protein n=1 Tax=Forsythia ovata TaxID=205694 RepID=A0ABD1WHZ3_9LAMI